MPTHSPSARFIVPMQQLRFKRDWNRHRPGERGPIIRRNGAELEMVELHWGLKPGRKQLRSIINIRAEGLGLPGQRCLVPASEFFLSTRRGPHRIAWKFTLTDSAPFYFAGIWRQASDDWPASYAVLT